MKRKYELIIEYIEKLVENKELKQGERLPAIRAMATEFKCNKSTVIRAYKELEMDHKVYAIPKSGYYLVEKHNPSSEKYDAIYFSDVIPESKLLPYKEFNHCINRAVEIYKTNLFSYSNPQGLESLRKVLVDHLSEHQIFTSAEKIFITTGSQQALCILSKMPFPNGKENILIEQPTYSLIHELVELNGGKLIGINRDHKGIDLDELERTFINEDIKFFYTIPRFHNPLGVSYSEIDKKKIVKLAEKYDVYIVEDDYLADINTDKKVLPEYYYDISQRVIYVKSFSKAFMPGIRIGAVVLHEQLRDEFFRYKRHYDLNTSVLAQGALEIFINSGMYKNHIKKVQFEYKKKMDFVKECIGKEVTYGIKCLIPETGFFVWIKLPKKINTSKLLKRLERRNVYVQPAEKFYIGNKPYEKGLRICISKLTINQIEIGIKVLFEEISRMNDE